MPSVTAPSHAALWTGAWGDVNGITANSQPLLPRDQHTLTELGSGFSARALRAEPIWITAGLTGMRVAGHHPTQAPAVPGYAPTTSDTPDSRLEELRQRAIDALARPNVQIVNGYNRWISPDLAITERTHKLRIPPIRWWGLDRLGRIGTPHREIAWTIGQDSVFAFFYGRESIYTSIVVAVGARDASSGVIAHVAPADTTWPVGRPLARHFSNPLFLPLTRGSIGTSQAVLRVRLFALAPSASSFLIYQPSIRIVESNHPKTAIEYSTAIEGWIGNSATALYRRGAFGKPLWESGDGLAESRYLESAELLTRQSMRGAEWMWHRLRPSLLLDYFPLLDDFEHLMYGFIDSTSARYDPQLAVRLHDVRRRGWALADLRLLHLRGLQRDAGFGTTALFVSGDHGMRPLWRVFRPNVVLAQAGLLAIDSAGQIDLSRSRAVSPNGYWISINRMQWKAGIVGPTSEEAILVAAEQALRSTLDPQGKPVVTRVFRAHGHDSLGLGGPVGGDLYYDVSPGYTWTASVIGSAVDTLAGLDAGHGFPSTAADMRTVFCADGGTFPTRRIGPVRLIDVIPTVADWLGTDPPLTSRGRSVLRPLSGQ